MPARRSGFDSQSAASAAIWAGVIDPTRSGTTARPAAMLGQARKPRWRMRQAVSATPSKRRSSGRRASSPSQPSQACISCRCWVGTSTTIGTPRAPSSAVLAPTVVSASWHWARAPWAGWASSSSMVLPAGVRSASPPGRLPATNRGWPEL